MLELGSILILGIVAQWMAWRANIPAIVPLIIFGLLAGPISEYYLGEKWLNPVYNGNNNGIFLADSLFAFVSIAIGIILFEGGLTLKKNEWHRVGSSVTKLITLGAAITFAGAGAAAYFITGLSFEIAFLFAGLVIVTGPTVIAPILRNVPLNKNVATILKWEGILIDPVGALTAVLVFEFILASHGHGHGSIDPFGQFAKVLVEGITLGLGGAYALVYLIKRHLIPHYLLNVFTLGLVVSVFVLSDLMVSESGLLTVVVMGLALGNMNVPNIDDILNFKESITILLISVLFIVLSANINWSDLERLDAKCFALLGFIIVILRPLSVFVSTYKSDLNINEKMFISWVGPRGIVAAGIASVFGLKLTTEGIAGAEMITPLVFLIVLGTVMLNATTARFVAQMLGVTLGKSNGIAIVGANQGSRLLAHYLKKHDRHVVLLDSSIQNIEAAKEEGLEAIKADVFADTLNDNLELVEMGYLFAMTGSHNVNTYAIENLKDTLGENGSFRFLSSKEMKRDNLEESEQKILFGQAFDFLKFSEIARTYPHIHEIELKSDTDFFDYLDMMNEEQKSVPVFIKQDEAIHVLQLDRNAINVAAGDILVYLGKEIETKDETEV